VVAPEANVGAGDELVVGPGRSRGWRPSENWFSLRR
jgi:hypothetical protein